MQNLATGEIPYGDNIGRSFFIHFQLAEGNWRVYVTAVYSSDEMKSGQKDFTVKTIVNYTVSYDANGGSGAPAAQLKTPGEALTLSSAVPTREGYSFLGWAESSGAAEARYLPGGSFTADADTVLYAVWQQQTVLSITRQPQNYAGPLGSRATFTVEAEGDGLSYQWWVKNRTVTKFSKSSITAATYSVTLTEANSGRQLYCVVTDAFGNSVQTDTVTMTVATPQLTILRQPANYTGPAGSTAVFSVVAEGEELTYQWYVKKPSATKFSKSSITAATYSVELTAARSGNRLYCVVTDAYGNTAQTDIVTMTVEQGPAAPVLTGASAGPNGITVTWNAVEGATKYRVYRKTGSGGWVSMGDVTTLSYMDGAVLSGTTYTYTVKAFDGSDWGDFDTEGISATAQ